jgi:hypothetical protein
MAGLGTGSSGGGGRVGQGVALEGVDTPEKVGPRPDATSAVHGEQNSGGALATRAWNATEPALLGEGSLVLQLVGVAVSGHDIGIT